MWPSQNNDEKREYAYCKHWNYQNSEFVDGEQAVAVLPDGLVEIQDRFLTVEFYRNTVHYEYAAASVQPCSGR